MLKHVSCVYGKREQEAINTFNNILQKATPREVSKSFVLLFAPATYNLGIILTAIFLGLILVASVISIAVQKYDFLTVVIPLFCFFLMISSILLIYASFSYINRVKILKEGTLYEGMIDTISVLPGRINGHTYYRMAVIFKDKDGKEKRLFNVIRSDIADTFFKLRDTENLIDVLYTEKVKNKILIPLNHIYLSRYN